MSDGVRGAQLVRRVTDVLRAVSARMPAGASGAELAQAAGLPRSTTQRLLAALMSDGFVDRDRGRWFLGPELYLLGTVAGERYDATEVARASVEQLAAVTGESAFFSARRGDETVCLLREEGSFPLRSFVLHVGIRFPLGVASAGMAILAHLPRVDAEAYLAGAGAAVAERFGDEHDPERLRERIAQTRRLGYSVNPGLIVEGSWGMGAAVFDDAGRPAWALSITGVESRFGAPRRRELGALLLDQAHQLTARLAGHTSRPSSAGR